MRVADRRVRDFSVYAVGEGVEGQSVIIREGLATDLSPEGGVHGADLAPLIVRLAGIVTGTSRKGERDERTVEDLKKLALKKYAETVHIDRDSVLRTRRDSRECTEIRLENASPAAWSGAVMDAIRQLQGE